MTKSLIMVLMLLATACSGKEPGIHLNKALALEACIDWIQDQYEIMILECKDNPENSEVAAVEIMIEVGASPNSKAEPTQRDHVTFKYQN